MEPIMFNDDLEYNASWQTFEYEHKRKSSKKFYIVWINSNKLIEASICQ